MYLRLKDTKKPLYPGKVRREMVWNVYFYYWIGFKGDVLFIKMEVCLTVNARYTQKTTVYRCHFIFNVCV